PHPPLPPALFPYTTLFRSHRRPTTHQLAAAEGRVATGDRDEPAVVAREHERAAHDLDRRGALVVADQGLRGRERERVGGTGGREDRKSTRLNSSHVSTSYA